MKPEDTTQQAIVALARGVRDLQQLAAQEYRPAVDEILRTSSRDAAHIERTLDGLLDFCGFEPCWRCPPYWAIDPVATAHYLDAYRDF